MLEKEKIENELKFLLENVDTGVAFTVEDIVQKSNQDNHKVEALIEDLINEGFIDQVDLCLYILLAYKVDEFKEE